MPMPCRFALAALVLALAACGRPAVPTPATTTVPTPVQAPVPPAASPDPCVPGPAPQVASALSGQGEVAFTSGCVVYAAGGPAGTFPLAVPQGGAPVGWSSDGRWLAITSGTPPARRLWLQASSGGPPLAVGLPGTVVAALWSPSADTLAVTVDGPPGVWLVAAGSEPRRRAALDGTVSAPLWSPSGRTIAVVETITAADAAGDTDRIETVPAAGGAPLVQDQGAPGPALYLAAWWPDAGGLLFWQVPLHGASLEDGSWPLQSLRFGGAPTTLAPSAPTFLPPASSLRSAAVAVVTGAGRGSQSDRQLQLCVPTAVRCSTVGGAPGTVALDPAWSPAGHRLAFVRAADTGIDNTLATAADVEAWSATVRLCVLDPATGAVTTLAAAGSGVADPTWSSDGQHLFFTRRDGALQSLWLVGSTGGPAVQLASGGDFAVWPA